MFFKRNNKIIPCSHTDLQIQQVLNMSDRSDTPNVTDQGYCQSQIDTLAEMKKAKIKLESDIIGLLNRFSIDHHTHVCKLELDTVTSTCVNGKVEYIITGLSIQLDI